MKKIVDSAFIIVILTLILIPIFSMNLEPDQVSKVENRKLAEKPVCSQGYTHYMNDLNTYINDRIGQRDNMMHFFNFLQHGMMKTNHDQVLYGKNDWLFYRDDISDYTGSNMDPSLIKRQVDIITALDQWCKERNIQFILAIGPNKSSVYYDYMPPSIFHCPKTSVDHTVEALRENGVAVAYPKKELIAHRMDKQLYYPLDTHWNAYGAEYMFYEIAKYLNLPGKEFEYTETTSYSGDLQNMLGIAYKGEPELEVAITPNPQSAIHNVENTPLDLVMKTDGAIDVICYRDSFTSSLLTYYGYYFEGPFHWQYGLDLTEIEESAPDVVILSCVERYFNHAAEANAAILNLK